MKLEEPAGAGEGEVGDGSSFQKLVSEEKPRREIVLRGNAVQKKEILLVPYAGWILPK